MSVGLAEELTRSSGGLVVKARLQSRSEAVRDICTEGAVKLGEINLIRRRSNGERNGHARSDRHALLHMVFDGG